MDYHSLAQRILDLAGGPDNIQSFTNCMTRLRLDLVRTQTADAEAIKEVDGVLGVVEGKQLQVVVGPGHAERLRTAFGEVMGSAGSAPATVTDPTAQDASCSTARRDGDSVTAQTELTRVAPEGDTDLAVRTKKKVRSKQTSRVQAIFHHVGTSSAQSFQDSLPVD